MQFFDRTFICFVPFPKYVGLYSKTTTTPQLLYIMLFYFRIFQHALITLPLPLYCYISVRHVCRFVWVVVCLSHYYKGVVIHFQLSNLHEVYFSSIRQKHERLSLWCIGWFEFYMLSNIKAWYHLKIDRILYPLCFWFY